MRWIHRDSVIRCSHDGRVRNQASQEWVTVAGVPVLVADDPTGRDIVACPNYGATVKPCTSTEPVRVGYSAWVRLGGRPIVLSHLSGFTNGSPPGQFTYRVRDARQRFVGADR